MEKIGLVNRNCPKCGANPLDVYRDKGKFKAVCWFCGQQIDIKLASVEGESASEVS